MMDRFVVELKLTIPLEGLEGLLQYSSCSLDWYSLGGVARVMWSGVDGEMWSGVDGVVGSIRCGLAG